MEPILFMKHGNGPLTVPGVEVTEESYTWLQKRDNIAYYDSRGALDTVPIHPPIRSGSTQLDHFLYLVLSTWILGFDENEIADVLAKCWQWISSWDLTFPYGPQEHAYQIQWCQENGNQIRRSSNTFSSIWNSIIGFAPDKRYTVSAGEPSYRWPHTKTLEWVPNSAGYNPTRAVCRHAQDEGRAWNILSSVNVLNHLQTTRKWY